MKIAIISPNYPTENSFSFSFVHDRAKLYQQKGHEVKVFNIAREESSYRFENIEVQKNTKNRLLDQVKEFSPDVLAVHFPVYFIISFINKLPFPKVVWLHGNDILWRTQLRPANNLLLTLKKYLVLIPRQGYQTFLLRKYLPRYKNCIFVSDGFLQKAQKHALRKFPNALVISNPVDIDKFGYKKPRFNKLGVSLRSFVSNIYGFDTAIKAMAGMGENRLDLIGKGRLKEKFIKMTKKYNSSCQVIDEFYNRDELPSLYYRYSYFAAPSRMDTQGLAMCEAMACGLPVIASNVGGIPDYVIDGYNGYLVKTNDPAAFRKAVIKLLSDENKFYEMSKNARQMMEQKCSSQKVINRELEVLRNAIESESLL